MRNKLTELTDKIDAFNADFSDWMKVTTDLMARREALINTGREFLTKKQMSSMLLSAKVTLNGLQTETPLADHLQNFDNTGYLPMDLSKVSE